MLIALIQVLPIFVALVILPSLYYFVQYPFQRPFDKGDIAWYKSGRGWELVKVTDPNPNGFDLILDVKYIDGPRTGCEEVAPRYRMRPVRWWQRNKVDPIVAKYFLLSGM